MLKGIPCLHSYSFKGMDDKIDKSFINLFKKSPKPEVIPTEKSNKKVGKIYISHECGFLKNREGIWEYLRSNYEDKIAEQIGNYYINDEDDTNGKAARSALKVILEDVEIEE